MVGTLVMGDCADRAIGVIVQIVVMVNNGVELRAEEQQKHKCRQVLSYGCPQ